MWLPFPAATVFDPRSRRLARLLEAPLYAALGILAGLWAQALEYAPSGILDGETLADLLAALGADPGPTRAALERAGWLVTRDDGYVELVGWDRLGGRLLEAREKHRARQARYRARRATGDGDRRVMVTRRSRDTPEYRRVQQKDQNRLDQIRLDEASPPSDYAAADSPTPQGNSAGGALMFSLARPLTAPAPLGDGEAREDRADAVMPTDAELDALYERGVEFFDLRNAKAETEWLLSHRDQWDRWLAIAKGPRARAGRRRFVSRRGRRARRHGAGGVQRGRSAARAARRGARARRADVSRPRARRRPACHRHRRARDLAREAQPELRGRYCPTPRPRRGHLG